MTSYEAASADIESIDEMIAKHPADARLVIRDFHYRRVIQAVP
jgi:hypothetical protein